MACKGHQILDICHHNVTILSWGLSDLSVEAILFFYKEPRTYFTLL